jgi:hypothetical protein
MPAILAAHAEPGDPSVAVIPGLDESVYLHHEFIFTQMSHNLYDDLKSIF